MTRIAGIYTFVWLLLLGCKEQQFAIPVSVQVVDHEGQVVEGATVYAGKLKLGTTNAKGLFSGRVETASNTAIALIVKKEDSSKNYYGPYQERISISEQIPLNIAVHAKLFFVPKPSKTEEYALSDEAANQPPSEVTNNEPEASTPTEPVAEVAAVDNQTVSAVTEVLSNDTPEASGSLVTLHSFAGLQAVGGTQFAWGLPDGNRLYDACVSNERGRCAFRLDITKPSKVVLQVRKPGYQTSFETVEIAPDANVRVQLKHGQSVDIQLLTRAYGTERGVAGAGVSINGMRLGETNQFGYFSYLLELSLIHI